MCMSVCVCVCLCIGEMRNCEGAKSYAARRRIMKYGRHAPKQEGPQRKKECRSSVIAQFKGIHSLFGAMLWRPIELAVINLD